MSTYYKVGGKGSGFDISQSDVPEYVKKFLNYELVIVNIAPRSVHNYYISLRTFLKWHESLKKTSVPFAEIEISNIPLERIKEITEQDIYAFLSYCCTERNNGIQSRTSKLAALKAFFKYMAEVDKSIDYNPAAAIVTPRKEKTLPKYLTFEESHRLLDAVSGETPMRDICIITFFLNCGMRLSELVAINKSDIKNRSLTLRGKGRKERVVFLNDACLGALSRYLEERESYKKIVDEDALFITKRFGKRITGRAIEQMLDRTLLRAGLDKSGFSPHKLRHTAATLMYQSGAAGILEIKEILGHSTTQMTEVYTHIESSAIKASMESFVISPPDT